MRRRDQQGAVAVMMALVTCFVLIPMAALAVDIGVQRVARRDMQAVADVVALDLSRQLTGGTYGSYTASKKAALQTIAEESRDRNATNIGSGSGGKSADISYELGTVDNAAYGTANYFTPTTASNVIPTAVRVKATATVGFGLANALPGDGFGSGSATRYAIGVRQSSACFKLGSYAAAIDTKGSTLLGPLNDLLGLNLGLVSYQGLAAASLNLASLAADSHIGSVDGLLNNNVTLGNFTAATIAVLQKQDKPGNAAAITALQAIQASGINLSKPVHVLDMISLQSTDSAALNSDVNVLDLISGAIQVANGEHGVDVSSLNAAGITGSIKVTQGIQTWCGVPNDPSPTAVAKSSQVKVDLGYSVPANTKILGVDITGGVKITGGIGNATGKLVSPNPIVCQAGTAAAPDSYSVAVTPGLLGLSATSNLELNGTMGTAQLGLLGTLLQGVLGTLIEVKFDHVKLGVNAITAPSATSSTKNLRVPQNSYNSTPKGSPLSAGTRFDKLGLLPSLTNDPLTVVSGKITMTTKVLFAIAVTTEINLDKNAGAGTAIAAVLDGVSNILKTAVNTTLPPLLDPVIKNLGDLIGLNAGGADVYSVSRPTCNGAKLVG
ncbi:putative membrane protein [Marmoricola sp. OAE513]|uniref:pilus assembly protein TadG-related protein n=1 Tax=Marmoricola sp. OAE513 TaxID=2817894 RepID=UPI001AE4F335